MSTQHRKTPLAHRLPEEQQIPAVRTSRRGVLLGVIFYLLAFAGFTGLLISAWVDDPFWHRVVQTVYCGAIGLCWLMLVVSMKRATRHD